MYKIAVMPGDGTGPEVAAEGIKVLKAVAALEHAHDAANLARDAEELATEIRAQQARRGEAAARGKRRGPGGTSWEPRRYPTSSAGITDTSTRRR